MNVRERIPFLVCGSGAVDCAHSIGLLSAESVRFWITSLRLRLRLPTYAASWTDLERGQEMLQNTAMNEPFDIGMTRARVEK